jgi:hypothetical protein
MAAKAEMEEVVVPKDLQEFLRDVVEGKAGFELGEPWKYSDKALAVVVPIIRKNAQRRAYITMYEVLKDMGMKDTGRIDSVELQNKTGKAVFVRVGTIFTGETQNRAAQHSGVYQGDKSQVPVRCVQQTHGIHVGAKMEFGDIAPLSVTMNLIADGDQSDIWESVRRYTGGDRSEHVLHGAGHHAGPMSSFGGSFFGYVHSESRVNPTMGPMQYRLKAQNGTPDEERHHFESREVDNVFNDCFPRNYQNGTVGTGTDDLLGHMKGLEVGKKMLDDMMQKVPLFPDQVGAIIFNPLGVSVIETFDHPLSWEAIKKEIIEKHGDKICQEQADHLFELKKEMILPAFKKFVDGLKVFKEQTIRKDDMSETRVLVGKSIVGEYTMVKGRVIHTILAKENN